MKAADQLLHAGNIAAAEALYRAVAAEDPNHAADAMVNVAFCARRRGQRTASLEIFRKLAAEQPGNARRLGDVADDLRALERFAEAVDLYRATLALNPAFHQAQIGLAVSLRRTNDTEGALAAAREAVRLQPDSDAYKRELLASLLAAGKQEEAAEQYRQRLKQAPEDLDALHGLATCLRRQGDRAAAAQHSLQAARLAPQNLRYQLEAAGDLRALGRLEEEEEFLRGALAQEPRHAGALRAMVSLTRLRQGSLAAMASARQILADDPNAAWAHLELAEDLRALAQFTEAETEYRLAYVAGQQALPALLGLGYCARQRGDRAEALARFRAASAHSPDQPRPLIEIALEQREAGQEEEAVATARALVQAHPDIWQAHLCLAHAERTASRHEAALTAIAAALTLNPGNADLLVERAFSEKVLGRLEDSAASIEAALAINPSHGNAVARAAEFHLAQGDNETPLLLYSQAVAIRPGDLALQVGLADALNAQGRATEAVARLTALEDELGMVPRLRAKRIALLRTTGHYHEALALARAGNQAAPENFQIALERCHCELLVGDQTGITASLKAMRPSTVKERAWHYRCLGMAAENLSQFSKAAHFYLAGAALAPEDTGIRNSLVRVKMLTFELPEARQHLAAATQADANNRRLRGKSLNMSQTHFGQMLDEYRMDEVMLTRITNLRNLPPAPRAAALLELVANDPSHTGAAVALLLAMRQAGAFETRLTRTEPRIPAQLFQFWDTAPPPEVRAMMQSWRDLNPGHRAYLLNDETARAYLARAFPGDVANAYASLREPAQKADLFRLAILVREGGVYADADDRALKPLANFIPAGAELVLHQEDLGTLGNNFIAAAPGQPILAAALKAAITAIHRGDSDILWLSTGPGLITRAFASALVEAGQGAIVPENCIIMHRREILQSVAMHCFVGYKRTNSHWLQGSFNANRGLRPMTKAG